MTRSRLVPAVLAMIAIPLAAGFLLPDFGRSVAWSVVQATLVFFLAALAGAWLAHGRFVAPALLVWALFCTVAVWLLQRHGTSIGQILQYNWLAIGLSGVATVAGALGGGTLAGGAGTAAISRHP